MSQHEPTLCSAALNGNVHECEILLQDHQVDINVKNCYSWTPLHYAVSKDHVDVAALLLRWGSRINEADCHGYTPILRAAVSGSLHATKLLFYCGASVSIKNMFCMNALHCAAINGHESVVSFYLLSRTFSLEDRDEDGMTPLLCAAKHFHVGVVKQLLKAGAKLSARDREENTALMFAQHHEGLFGMLSHWRFSQAVWVLIAEKQHHRRDRKSSPISRLPIELILMIGTF